VITKTANWSLIVAGLKELQRSKKITNKIMSKIKELDKNNEKSKDN
tara:strand:+ start:1664 stop:1801 length:138 start_codon:yes stop_codon:yes gene_type:complete